MNSRVKTLVRLGVLGSVSLFIGSTTPADSSLTRADVMDWSTLKTEKIEIENASSGQGAVFSSYPAKLHKILGEALSWDPAKELNNSTQLAPILERYSNSDGPGFNPTEMLRNLSIEFNVSDRSHFRKVWFHLRTGLKVRGLFALHDFSTKRPLVILRLGIHGNVDELLAERFILRALYQDLNLNVLVLENLTSHAFLSQNAQVTFGGVEEGLHSFFILQMLSDPKYPLGASTSSYHMVGVSLGAQGTFVTSLLDSTNGKKIKSILNFCPLLNLKETFEVHNQKSFMNVGIDFWNSHRLQALYGQYPKELSALELWKMPFDRKPRFTKRVLKILNEERKKPLFSADDAKENFPKTNWPKGFGDLITKANSFYEMNDFWSLYKNVSTPVTIYTTPKDFLVTNELNSDRILEKNQPGDLRNFKVIKLERGTHCGLASVYIWSDVVKYIKEGLALSEDDDALEAEAVEVQTWFREHYTSFVANGEYKGQSE